VLTFKEWILKFKEVDLPIGDFAREVGRDQHFPNSIIYEEIMDHLEYDSNSSSLFIESFESIYRYYLDSHSFLLVLR
jgi:hypothetical protein